MQLADASQVNFYADGIPNFDEELGALDRAMVDVMKGMRSQDPEDYKVLLKQDLANVRGPYIVIAAIVFCFWLIFAFSKLPAFKAQGEVASFWTVARSLFVRKHFVEGVIAQLCYVGSSDHVLDFYHSLRDGTGGFESGAGAKFQYRSDGFISDQSLYLYLSIELL